MFQYPSPFRPTVTFRGSWPSGSPRVWRWVAVWTVSAPAGGDQKLTLTFLGLTMSQTNCREREHGVQLRGSRKMYGSVERVECEGEAADTSRRFRVESHSATHQVSPGSATTILPHTEHNLGWGQKLSVMSLNNHGKNNFLCDNLLAADSSSICPNVVVCLSVVCLSS